MTGVGPKGGRVAKLGEQLPQAGQFPPTNLTLPGNATGAADLVVADLDGVAGPDLVVLSNEPDYRRVKLFRNPGAAVARDASAWLPEVIEVDMSDVVAWRRRRLIVWEREYGVHISLTDVIAFAVAQTLRDSPDLNARLENQEIKVLADIHLGIAVATGTASTASFVFVALSMGAAAMVPWGMWPQLIVSVLFAVLYPLVRAVARIA